MLAPARLKLDLDQQARICVARLDRALMQLHCAAGDGKPKAHAATCAIAIGIHTVERIEDSRQCFGADSHAIILHCDSYPARLKDQTYLNPTSVANFMDCLLGVGDEIQKNLDKLVAGQPASIKYDPSNPTDSILVADDWSGLR